jgi:hypothetical protein
MAFHTRLVSVLETSTDVAHTAPLWHMTATKNFGLTTQTVKSATYQVPGTGEVALVTGPLTGAGIPNSQAVLIENKAATGFVWVRAFVRFAEFTPTGVVDRVTIEGSTPFVPTGTSNMLFSLRWGNEAGGVISSGQDVASLGAMAGGVLLIKTAPLPNKGLSGLAFPIVEVFTDTTSASLVNNGLMCVCEDTNGPVNAVNQDITCEFGAMLQQKVVAGDQLQITGNLMETAGFNKLTVPTDQMSLSVHGDGVTAFSEITAMVTGV